MAQAVSAFQAGHLRAWFVANRAGMGGWCHTSAHENKGTGPAVNGDGFRDTTFLANGTGKCYDGSEVDDLLDRVAAELDAGRLGGPLIRNATFSRGEGYDIYAVDWFLEEFLRREDQPELAGASADPWRDHPIVNQMTRSGLGRMAERPVNPSKQARGEYRAEVQKHLGGHFLREWRGFGQLPGVHL